MNHELYRYMKISMNQNNNINELYRTFWVNTLKQFKENNEENGLFFWLQKMNNNYVIFYHGVNGIDKEEIKMNEEEKELVMKMLACDGFKISETDNNSTLLIIEKKKITNYLENTQKEIKTVKMSITPFAETRRRK